MCVCERDCDIIVACANHTPEMVMHDAENWPVPVLVHPN